MNLSSSSKQSFHLLDVKTENDDSFSINKDADEYNYEDVEPLDDFFLLPKDSKSDGCENSTLFSGALLSKLDELNTKKTKAITKARGSSMATISDSSSFANSFNIAPVFENKFSLIDYNNSNNKKRVCKGWRAVRVKTLGLVRFFGTLCEVRMSPYYTDGKLLSLYIRERAPVDRTAVVPICKTLFLFCQEDSSQAQSFATVEHLSCLLRAIQLIAVAQRQKLQLTTHPAFIPSEIKNNDTSNNSLNRSVNDDNMKKTSISVSHLLSVGEWVTGMRFHPQFPGKAFVQPSPHESAAFIAKIITIVCTESSKGRLLLTHCTNIIGSPGDTGNNAGDTGNNAETVVYADQMIVELLLRGGFQPNAARALLCAAVLKESDVAFADDISVSSVAANTNDEFLPLSKPALRSLEKVINEVSDEVNTLLNEICERYRALLLLPDQRPSLHVKVEGKGTTSGTSAGVVNNKNNNSSSNSYSNCKKDALDLLSERLKATFWERCWKALETILAAVQILVKIANECFPLPNTVLFLVIHTADVAVRILQRMIILLAVVAVQQNVEMMRPSSRGGLLLPQFPNLLKKYENINNNTDDDAVNGRQFRSASVSRRFSITNVNGRRASEKLKKQQSLLPHKINVSQGEEIHMLHNNMIKLPANVQNILSTAGTLLEQTFSKLLPVIVMWHDEKQERNKFSDAHTKLINTLLSSLTILTTTQNTLPPLPLAGTSVVFNQQSLACGVALKCLTSNLCHLLIDNSARALLSNWPSHRQPMLFCVKRPQSAHSEVNSLTRGERRLSKNELDNKNKHNNNINNNSSFPVLTRRFELAHCCSEQLNKQKQQLEQSLLKKEHFDALLAFLKEIERSNSHSFTLGNRKHEGNESINNNSYNNLLKYLQFGDTRSSEPYISMCRTQAAEALLLCSRTITKSTAEDNNFCIVAIQKYLTDLLNRNEIVSCDTTLISVIIEYFICQWKLNCATGGEIVNNFVMQCLSCICKTLLRTSSRFLLLFYSSPSHEVTEMNLLLLILGALCHAAEYVGWDVISRELLRQSLAPTSQTEKGGYVEVPNSTSLLSPVMIIQNAAWNYTDQNSVIEDATSSVCSLSLLGNAPLHVEESPGKRLLLIVESLMSVSVRTDELTNSSAHLVLLTIAATVLRCFYDSTTAATMTTEDENKTRSILKQSTHHLNAALTSYYYSYYSYSSTESYYKSLCFSLCYVIRTLTPLALRTKSSAYFSELTLLLADVASHISLCVNVINHENSKVASPSASGPYFDSRIKQIVDLFITTKIKCLSGIDVLLLQCQREWSGNSSPYETTTTTTTAAAETSTINLDSFHIFAMCTTLFDDLCASLLSMTKFQNYLVSFRVCATAISSLLFACCAAVVLPKNYLLQQNVRMDNTLRFVSFLVWQHQETHRNALLSVLTISAESLVELVNKDIDSGSEIGFETLKVLQETLASRGISNSSKAKRPITATSALETITWAKALNHSYAKPLFQFLGALIAQLFLSKEPNEEKTAIVGSSFIQVNFSLVSSDSPRQIEGDDDNNINSELQRGLDITMIEANNNRIELLRCALMQVVSGKTFFLLFNNLNLVDEEGESSNDTIGNNKEPLLLRPLFGVTEEEGDSYKSNSNNDSPNNTSTINDSACISISSRFWFGYALPYIDMKANEEAKNNAKEVLSLQKDLRLLLKKIKNQDERDLFFNVEFAQRLMLINAETTDRNNIAKYLIVSFIKQNAVISAALSAAAACNDIEKNKFNIEEYQSLLLQRDISALELIEAEERISLYNDCVSNRSNTILQLVTAIRSILIDFEVQQKNKDEQNNNDNLLKKPNTINDNNSNNENSVCDIFSRMCIITKQLLVSAVEDRHNNSLPYSLMASPIKDSVCSVYGVVSATTIVNNDNSNTDSPIVMCSSSIRRGLSPIHSALKTNFSPKVPTKTLYITDSIGHFFSELHKVHVAHETDLYSLSVSTLKTIHDMERRIKGLIDNVMNERRINNELQIALKEKESKKAKAHPLVKASLLCDSSTIECGNSGLQKKEEKEIEDASRDILSFKKATQQLQEALHEAQKENQNQRITLVQQNEEINTIKATLLLSQQRCTELEQQLLARQARQNQKMSKRQLSAEPRSTSFSMAEYTPLRLNHSFHEETSPFTTTDDLNDLCFEKLSLSRDERGETRSHKKFRHRNDSNVVAEEVEYLWDADETFTSHLKNRIIDVSAYLANLKSQYKSIQKIIQSNTKLIKKSPLLIDSGNLNMITDKQKGQEVKNGDFQRPTSSPMKTNKRQHQMTHQQYSTIDEKMRLKMDLCDLTTIISPIHSRLLSPVSNEVISPKRKEDKDKTNNNAHRKTTPLKATKKELSVEQQQQGQTTTQPKLKLGDSLSPSRKRLIAAGFPVTSHPVHVSEFITDRIKNDEMINKLNAVHRPNSQSKPTSKEKQQCRLNSLPRHQSSSSFDAATRLKLDLHDSSINFSLISTDLFPPPPPQLVHMSETIAKNSTPFDLRPVEPYNKFKKHDPRNILNYNATKDPHLSHFFIGNRNNIK